MAVQAATKTAGKAGQKAQPSLVSPSFQQRLQRAELPVVIDVWAPWCGPCRAMEPHLAAVRSEYTGRVDVWKINADEHQDVVRDLRIFGIPTLVVYSGGVEVTRRTGGMNASTIRALFERALAPVPEPGSAPAHKGPTDYERWLRIAVALALLILAAFTGWPIVLLLVAAGVFFSAIHDRCPIWQAVKTRIGLG
jgi:thioredoxin